jgi:hypothetical protein
MESNFSLLTVVEAQAMDVNSALAFLEDNFPYSFCSGFASGNNILRICSAFYEGGELRIGLLRSNLFLRVEWMEEKPEFEKVLIFPCETIMVAKNNDRRYQNIELRGEKYLGIQSINDIVIILDGRGNVLGEIPLAELEKTANVISYPKPPLH